jgi:hypothetical protein
MTLCNPGFIFDQYGSKVELFNNCDGSCLNWFSAEFINWFMAHLRPHVNQASLWINVAEDQYRITKHDQSLPHLPSTVPVKWIMGHMETCI